MSYVKKEISLHLLEQMEKDAHNILERICVLPDEEKVLLYLKEIVEKGGVINF